MGTQTINSGLGHAPDFTPHRYKVVAADAAFPNSTVLKAHGMASDPYEDVFAQVQILGGSAVSVNVDILLWSDLDQQFLPQMPAVTFTAIAASKVLKFNTGGQRFFMNLSGTFGGCTVNASCAGANPVLGQNA